MLKTGIIAFAVSAVATPGLLPFLRKLGARQSIREDGPQEHLEKTGTPTMGGIAIVCAVAVATLTAGLHSRKTVLMLAWMAGYGLIGFIDDFLITARRENLGLTARQKLLLQAALAFLGALWYRMDGSGASLIVPFAGIRWNFGPLYALFVTFVAVAMTNAVNLTDGLDGLASSVTAIAAVCLAAIGASLASAESAAFSSAIAGACLGFLLYNRHPAKLFMGDTGSLALGGALAATAVTMDAILFLPILGAVYVAEALSVIVQVYVFKTQNERRFFRMAPLHHHFELGGWSENKVVVVFSAVTLACSVLAYLGL